MKLEHDNRLPHPIVSFTFCSPEGKRIVTVDEKFFTGYRKTMLKPEEILLSIEIPYSRKVSCWD